MSGKAEAEKMKPHFTDFEVTSHEGEEFYYVLSGCGIFIVEGVEHCIHAGETIHFPSDKSHQIQTRCGASHVDCDDAASLLAKIYFWALIV